VTEKIKAAEKIRDHYLKQYQKWSKVVRHLKLKWQIVETHPDLKESHHQGPSE